MIEELKNLAEAEPVAWSRSDRFVNHYRETTDRPENATSDVNEWKALYSEETVAALIERVERAEAENARMREALEFYAEPANFLNSPPWEEDPECFTPNAVPFTTQEDGAKVCDCGDKARAALGRRS